MAVATPDKAELGMSGARVDSRSTSNTRLTISVVAAVVSVAAALVAAIGPAKGHHSDYSWPPATIPPQSPREGWYTPLALLNRVPASIDVRLPCGLSPSVRGGRSATVLATTRRSQATGGFEVRRTGDSMRFQTGNAELARVSWPASCPLTVSVRDGELRLPGRAVPTGLDTPGRMPIVTSLFTRLDLRHGNPPQVALRTRDYATSQTGRQIAAALLAGLLACVALLLVADALRLRSPLPALRGGLRSAWSGRHLTDAVVVGGLVLWWVIAPNFSDDGWILNRFLEYPGSGGFSLYYDQYGANQPLGFWLEWSEHFLAPYGLLVLRLPALACLIASWALCRRVLSRSLQASMRRNAVVLWAFAAAFLVGALSWGMTLRPEPVISFLTLVVLAAMLAFAAAPRFGALALAVPVSALAITGHTTGIVAMAPLIACLPRIARTARALGSAAVLRLAALLGAGVALVLVLFTLDSDFGTRVGDSRLVEEGGLHSEPPWREYVRYVNFDQFGGSWTVRHLSLLLLLLCVLAMVTRRRSIATGASLLPTRTVAVGLVLLAFVPSKWPWHFGALAAIGAVAIAVEVTRLIGEGCVVSARRPRGLIALLVLTAAVAWSWTGLKESTPFELVTITWKSGFNVYSLLVVALAVAAGAFWWRRRDPDVRVSASIPGIVIAVAGLSAIAITAGIVVADTAIAPWSPARLNTEDLVGGTSGCGLADHVPARRTLGELMSDRSSRSLLVPPISPYFPCASLPALEGGRLELPNIIGIWFDQWPVGKRDSPFQAATDLYEYQRVAHKKLMTIYAGQTIVPGFQLVGVAPQSSSDS